MKVKYIVCEKCGFKERLKTPASDNADIAKIMLSKCYCYECAYWEAVKIGVFGNYEIINGTCYSPLPAIYDEKIAISVLGQDGKKMWIMKRDGKVIYSNDCWLIGKIPTRLLKEFPDTAYMVTRRAYNLIRKNKKKCKKIGCMDRYHCYFYDINCELSGPFNKIPKDYVVGSEKCTRFVNLNKDIKRYDITTDFKTDSKHIS